MKSTRPTENVEGARLSYNQSSVEHLSETEKTKYWQAVQEAEDNLAKIARIQIERTGMDGDIQSPLSDNELEALRECMEAFEPARIRISRWRDPDDKAERELFLEHLQAQLEAGVPLSDLELPEELRDSDEQTDAGTDFSKRN